MMNEKCQGHHIDKLPHFMIVRFSLMIVECEQQVRHAIVVERLSDLLQVKTIILLPSILDSRNLEMKST